MSEFEKKLLKRIEKLENELAKSNLKLKNEREDSNTYKFSKITDNDLENIVSIKREFDKNIFNKWFNSDIILSEEVVIFLQDLLKKEENYIKIYKEEDLKINFITPIINKVNFKISNTIRAFYEEYLVYKSDEFTLKGKTDFIVSKGYKTSKKPYFFIQEFKRELENSDPEPQLLAELISAVELNNWSTIKGAYIIGENWNFVILNRLDRHKYEYSISGTFNSTKIEDLKGIYKNLLFIKQEIIEMISK